MFDPDPELQDLPASEVRAVAVAAGESVLRRDRALMELGRRASCDAALLTQAALISDPANQRLITAGTVTVSQLGAAGLIAGRFRLAYCKRNTTALAGLNRCIRPTAYLCGTVCRVSRAG